MIWSLLKKVGYGLKHYRSYSDIAKGKYSSIGKVQTEKYGGLFVELVGTEEAL